MLSLEKGDMRLSVDPEDGMTVTSIMFNGIETVLFDYKRKQDGATYGIPLLFPTPNRVSGDYFIANGRRIPAVMHGPFRHRVFRVEELASDRIYAVCDFSKDDMYFPYEGSLGLGIGLEEDGVTWRFTVSNKDVVPFSYGIALHPFFRKAGEGTFTANVLSLMISDGDKIPTGRLADVEGTDLDFRSPVPVSSIDTDSVFITNGRMKAELDFRCYKVIMDASDAFGHVVVYTSPDRDFICVEPQSCSTDAHNLYAKGYAAQSGLITSAPGAVQNHFFNLKFN